MTQESPHQTPPLKHVADGPLNQSIENHHTDEEIFHRLGIAKNHYEVTTWSQKLNNVPEKGKHAVYFIYCQGIIIYIGSSSNIPQRISQHRSYFGSAINNIRFVYLPNEKEMLELERKLINSVKPLFNDTHKNHKELIAQLLENAAQEDRSTIINIFDTPQPGTKFLLDLSENDFYINQQEFTNKIINFYNQLLEVKLLDSPIESSFNHGTWFMSAQGGIACEPIRIVGTAYNTDELHLLPNIHLLYALALSFRFDDSTMKFPHSIEYISFRKNASPACSIINDIVMISLDSYFDGIFITQALFPDSSFKKYLPGYSA